MRIGNTQLLRLHLRTCLYLCSIHYSYRPELRTFSRPSQSARPNTVVQAVAKVNCQSMTVAKVRPPRDEKPLKRISMKLIGI